MTADELFNLPNDDSAERWLIAGELRDRKRKYRSPNHASVLTAIGSRLIDWVKAQASPSFKVYGYGCPYRLTRDPDTVMAFDVSVVPRQLADATPKRARYIEGVPALAVEILDQDDSEAYVRDFMTAVSAARVQLFWMVNPNIPSVIAVRPDRQDEMAILGDIVSGDPVFPDFQIPLPELVG